MKTILLLIALALPCAADSIFSGGISIQSGTGDDQKSNAYQFNTPYVLQWTLRDQAPSKRDNPYWRPTTDSGWKEKWVQIDVRDAATGKLVVSQMLSGRENHFNVPSGGKHYIIVNGDRYIAWDVKAKEGRVVVTEKGEVMEAPKPGGWAKAPPTAPRPAVPPVPPAEVATTAENAPTTTTTAPEPKPSSVPGLPAGVEPTKKVESGLPPGMMKRGK